MRSTALTILLSYTVCVVGWKNKKIKKKELRNCFGTGRESGRRWDQRKRDERDWLRESIEFYSGERRRRERVRREGCDGRPRLNRRRFTAARARQKDIERRMEKDWLRRRCLFGFFEFWIFFFCWWVCLFGGFCFGLCPDSFSYEKTLKLMITWKHEVKAWIFTWNC